MCPFCNSCNGHFFVKHEGAVMFINAVLITLITKLFWCNVIRITGLPVLCHKISISFHYFQIDDSNKAGSMTVGNLF